MELTRLAELTGIWQGNIVHRNRMDSRHLTDDFPEVGVGFQHKGEYSDILIELVGLQ